MLWTRAMLRSTALQPFSYRLHFFAVLTLWERGTTCGSLRGAVFSEGLALLYLPEASQCSDGQPYNWFRCTHTRTEIHMHSHKRKLEKHCKERALVSTPSQANIIAAVLSFEWEQLVLILSDLLTDWCDLAFQTTSLSGPCVCDIGVVPPGLQ